MSNNIYPKFYKDWLETIKKNKNKILKKKIIGTVKRNGKIRSILIDTKIKTKENKIFERSVLIEKPGVIIIPILYFRKTLYTVLVKQFRICKGEDTLEFPSGNAENKNFTMQAIKELEEETQIKISKSELKKLDSIQMITSSNSSIAHYYYFKKKVNKKFLKLLDKLNTGNRHENELLSLKVLKVKDLYRINVANIFAGLTMLKKRKII